MTNKSKSTRFLASPLVACFLLLTLWLPVSFAGSGHDHDSDGGHDHGHENAPATEAFYPDDGNATETKPVEKTDSHQDDHHHGSGNDHHKH